MSSRVNDKLIKIIADKDKEIYELKNSQTDEIKLNNFIKKLKPNTTDLLIINNIGFFDGIKSFGLNFLFVK